MSTMLLTRLGTAEVISKHGTAGATNLSSVGLLRDCLLSQSLIRLSQAPKVIYRVSKQAFVCSRVGSSTKSDDKK